MFESLNAFLGNPSACDDAKQRTPALSDASTHGKCSLLYSICSSFDPNEHETTDTLFTGHEQKSVMIITWVSCFLFIF